MSTEKPFFEIGNRLERLEDAEHQLRGDPNYTKLYKRLEDKIWRTEREQLQQQLGSAWPRKNREWLTKRNVGRSVAVAAGLVIGSAMMHDVFTDDTPPIIPETYHSATTTQIATVASDAEALRRAGYCAAELRAQATVDATYAQVLEQQGLQLPEAYRNRAAYLAIAATTAEQAKVSCTASPQPLSPKGSARTNAPRIVSFEVGVDGAWCRQRDSDLVRIGSLSNDAESPVPLQQYFELHLRTGDRLAASMGMQCSRTVAAPAD
jgi:hypothetical protein